MSVRFPNGFALEPIALVGFGLKSSSGSTIDWEGAEMQEDFLTIGAAIELVANTGWRAFPVGLDKKPIVKGWHELASNDPAELTKIFGNSRISRVGIGIATGKSSDLAVLDIDTGPEKDGRVWLNSLGQALPTTASSNTPSGGKHFFFRFPSFDLRNSASFIAPGVDIRGEGGYIVAPPSRNTKGRYQWDVAPLKGGELLAPFPDWLTAKLIKRTVNWSARGYTFRPWERIQRSLMAPISEGTRNDALTRRCGTLCRVHGATYDWVATTLHQINLQCCQPPLSPREVDGIARSIFRKEFGGL
jgi:putative DNA primase/helicase